MTDFTDVLDPLSSRLPLPQPARSRVLLEIAADLEDAYRHYRDAGLPEPEARRRAMEAFELSDQALAELVQVHTSPFRKLLDRLSGQAQSRWERAVLIVVAASVAIIAVEMMLRETVIRDAGTLVWPALICGMSGLLLGLSKFYQLYIKQDHEIRSVRRGLDAIAALAGAQVLLGFLACWLYLYKYAELISSNVANTFNYLFEWLLSSAALLSVSISGGLFTAFIWFVLAQRAAGIEDAEAALLLASNNHASTNGPVFSQKSDR
jgi:hypothetical protein